MTLTQDQKDQLVGGGECFLHAHTPDQILGLPQVIQQAIDQIPPPDPIPPGTYLIPANNLSELASASAARSNLGLGAVNNTSDLDKPISTATSTALSGKANTIHSHVIGDITALQTALDAKLNLTGGAITGDLTVSGNVGVAAVPAAKMHVYSINAGTPETSGSGTTGVTARFQNINVNFDFGTYGSGACFIQPRLAGNNATVFNLLLNPTGGNVLVTGSGGLGYGVGSGGAVTQATSKSTAVTLNKPCGQITMNNAALAAGASVSFIVNTTSVTANDVVCVASPAFGLNYRIECSTVAPGLFYIRVTNISGGSLSEAIVINFAVIKGASS